MSRESERLTQDAIDLMNEGRWQEVSMLMPNEKLTPLQKKIAALSPADKLRLAAAFVETSRYDVARAIAIDVADYLYAMMRGD